MNNINDKKFCFIICSDSESLLNECVEYINELIEQVKELKEEIARRGRIINELKIQRKEANNIIKQYCFYEYGKPYLKKWGVE